MNFRAILAAACILTLMPVAALAQQGVVERVERRSNASVDRDALRLIRWFSKVDRGPKPADTGRRFGSDKPPKLKRDNSPSWLGHWHKQVSSGLRNGWRHPLSDIAPVVMPVAGGPARAVSWDKLVCRDVAGRQRTTVEAAPLWPLVGGVVQVVLTLQCADTGKVQLVVRLNSNGLASESFGLHFPPTVADMQLHRALLLSGHKPLLQLPDNAFIAQVQWSQAAPPSDGSLPRWQPYGPRKVQQPTRGVWLFTSDGKPANALAAPTTKFMLRFGVSDTPPDTTGAVVIEQKRVKSTRLRWIIDKGGKLRSKSRP